MLTGRVNICLISSVVFMANRISIWDLKRKLEVFPSSFVNQAEIRFFALKCVGRFLNL
jgi:hypothetical protein